MLRAQNTLSHKVNDTRRNRPSNSICVWNETMCNARAWPNKCWKSCANGSNIITLRFGDHGTEEMLGVVHVGLKG